MQEIHVHVLRGGKEPYSTQGSHTTPHATPHLNKRGVGLRQRKCTRSRSAGAIGARERSTASLCEISAYSAPDYNKAGARLLRRGVDEGGAGLEASIQCVQARCVVVLCAWARLLRRGVDEGGAGLEAGLAQVHLGEGLTPAQHNARSD